ncbi:nitroreductase family deazaflavin-dependent oxidoreductase [Streptomyces sp. NPDC090025]|uniref:nitroreductase family deazaflavin-dependent oxidoreductase n=1 Tax=Streptomyces sp. NPDC090025 TaxID=3365922 RepID=UPI00383971B3
MALVGVYEPSPTQWVRDQVELYESSGGTEGTTIRGDLPVILLTSVGARSGKIRKTPLMRVEHEGAYALVASNAGAVKHPVWYHNLVSSPLVELRDGTQVWEMKARLLSGEERAVWWERAVAAFSDYADYQARAEREIPLFVVEPTAV